MTSAHTPRRYLGEQQAGAREYEPATRKRVVDELLAHHVGRRNAVTTEGLALAVDVPARTVRAVISDADGVDFLISNDGDGGGLFVCEVADEGEITTRKLQARARSEFQRAARRQAFANNMTRREPRLEGFD